MIRGYDSMLCSLPAVTKMWSGNMTPDSVGLARSIAAVIMPRSGAA